MQLWMGLRLSFFENIFLCFFFRSLTTCAISHFTSWHWMTFSIIIWLCRLSLVILYCLFFFTFCIHGREGDVWITSCCLLVYWGMVCVRRGVTHTQTHAKWEQILSHILRYTHTHTHMHTHTHTHTRTHTLYKHKYMQRQFKIHRGWFSFCTWLAMVYRFDKMLKSSE